MRCRVGSVAPPIPCWAIVRAACLCRCRAGARCRERARPYGRLAPSIGPVPLSIGRGRNGLCPARRARTPPALGAEADTDPLPASVPARQCHPARGERARSRHRHPAGGQAGDGQATRTAAPARWPARSPQGTSALSGTRGRRPGDAEGRRRSVQSAAPPRPGRGRGRSRRRRRHGRPRLERRSVQSQRHPGGDQNGTGTASSTAGGTLAGLGRTPFPAHVARPPSYDRREWRKGARDPPGRGPAWWRWVG